MQVLSNTARINLIISFISILLTITLGISVLFGWFLKIPTLIQVMPEFVPMQFNTALGFLGLGLSFLFLHRKHFKTSCFFGTIVLLIGVLTLLEYIFNIDLYIDELFMDHYITVETPNPGRMAPNTALNFSLSGLSLIIFSLSKASKRYLLSGSFSLLVLLLGFIALFGYYIDFESFYKWGAVTNMAVHTAIGFMIFSFGYLLFIWTYFDKKDFVFSSIFRRLILMILIPIIPLYVVLAALDLRVLKNTIELAKDKELAEQTYKYTNELDHKIYELEEILKKTRRNLLVEASLTEGEVFRILQETLEKDSLIFGVALAFDQYKFSPNQKLFAPFIHKSDTGLVKINLEETIDYTSSSIEWFNKPIETGRSAWTDPFRIMNADSELVCAYGLPLYKNNQLFAVLALGINLDDLNVLLTPERLESYNHFVFSNTGYILHNSLNKNTIGESFYESVQRDWYSNNQVDSLKTVFTSLSYGKVEFKNPKTKQKRWLYYTPLISAPWKVFLSISEEEALAPVKKEFTKQLLLLLLVVIIISLFIIIVSKKISKPVKTLSIEANRIAKGDFSSSIEVNMTDEVGHLAQSFNTMKQKLDERGKSLIESEKRLQFAFKSSKSGLWDWQSKKGTIYLSPEYYSILGFENNEYAPSKVSWLESVHKEDLERVKEIHQNYLKGDIKELNIEYRRKKKNGDYIWLSDQSSMISWNEEGELLRVTGVIRDISDRKNAEIQLKKSNENLEEKVKTRTLELKDSEEKSRLILESAGEGILGTDINGNTTFINSSAIQMLGFGINEVLGKNIHDLSHYKRINGEHYPLDECPMHESYTKGKTNYIDSEVLWKKDGSSFPVEYTSKPIRKDDKIVGAVITFRDITDRKIAENKLRKSELKLKSLFDALPVGVAMIDNKGDIQEANSISEDILGLSTDIEKQKEFEDQEWKIIRPDNTPMPMNEFPASRALSGEGIIKGVEMGVIRPDGSKIWISTSVAPLSHEDGGVAVAFLDISDRKEFEESLKEAKKIAETATEAKSRFLASMSHEIRTPMNAIIGMSHLIQKTNLNNKQLDYISKIDKSAKTLLEIINDILDYSKIESGKLSIEKTDFDLENVFENVSNLISLKAQEKGLELLFKIAADIPLNLIGDPLRLGQIITNLASNAVKFTNIGEVIISAKLKESTTDHHILLFEITDTGIGLTEAQQNKLFEAFNQADSSTTRKYGGTGLGLSISKNLVELMHGEIQVESEYEQGSTFWFTAKFDKPQKDRFREFQPSIDLRGMKVLVCDDNETSRELLREALESFTFNVTTVNSGHEAIEILKQETKEPFELVLMDFKMPEIDGLETSKIIKEDKNIQKTPLIIMVTAYGMDAVVDEVEKTDLEGLLIKPISYSLLFDTIMSLFGKNIKRESRFSSKGKRHIEDLKQLEGTKILLVEDNEINQQVAQELLEDIGIIVDIAENGKIAVEKIKASGIESKYDLVFMDLHMPIMDGYNASREIRKLKDFKTLPIIAMTADAMLDVKEKVIESGMMDMVTKPIDPEEVYNAIYKWTNKGKNLDISALKMVPSPHQEPVFEKIPEINGLQTKAALKRLNNNTKLYFNLLYKFHTTNKNFAKELQQEFENKKYELAHRLIHTFKGVSGNIGADHLSERAMEIETIIREKDLAKFEKQLPIFHTELSELCLNLSQLPSEMNKPLQEPLDKDSIKKLIPEIKNLLESKNPKAKTKVSELNKAGLNNHFYNNLVQSINKYDFKKSLEILNEIIKTLD